MASAEDIDDDGIDEVIHADDMGMEGVFEMLQFGMMEM
mgnify:CR=1 FL=1